MIALAENLCLDFSARQVVMHRLASVIFGFCSCQRDYGRQTHYFSATRRDSNAFIHWADRDRWKTNLAIVYSSGLRGHWGVSPWSIRIMHPRGKSWEGTRDPLSISSWFMTVSILSIIFLHVPSFLSKHPLSTRYFLFCLTIFLNIGLSLSFGVCPFLMTFVQLCLLRPVSMSVCLLLRHRYSNRQIYIDIGAS